MLDFSEDAADTPKPGVATLATMHGAKGLEWDHVYLLSVNNYSFPGGGDEDGYREPFYARDSLNLVAEAQAQLKLLDMGDSALDEYAPGEATSQGAHRRRRRATAPALCGHGAGATGVDRALQHRTQRRAQPQYPRRRVRSAGRGFWATGKQPTRRHYAIA